MVQRIRRTRLHLGGLLKSPDSSRREFRLRQKVGEYLLTLRGIFAASTMLQRIRRTRLRFARFLESPDNPRVADSLQTTTGREAATFQGTG